MASDELVGRIHSLTLEQSGGQNQAHTASPPTNSRTAFPKENVNNLVLYVSATVSHAQAIGTATRHMEDFEIGSMSDVCLLYEQAKRLIEVQSRLENAIKAILESPESSVVNHLKSLGQNETKISHATPIAHLLSHFDGKIRNIVRKVLDRAKPEEVLWRIAEECFKESCFQGILNSDDYFVPLGETQMGWHYDSDCEDELYFENEGRLDLDEGYAESWRERTEKRIEGDRERREGWRDFWIQVLDHTLGGPTLFYPRANNNVKLPEMPAVPPYLFRTFDKCSHRQIAESAIASSASHEPRKNHKDLLAMDKFNAAKLLYNHFNWRHHDKRGKEINLASWTSSLPYAIQYALYRRQDHKDQRRLLRDDEIKICVIDTRRFPKGQFVRDIELLNAYHATAEMSRDREVLSHFNFRLKTEAYHNGEYLSQGAVKLAGRFCMVSLEQLENAGLFRLYPEFSVQTSGKWAKVLCYLREQWRDEQETANEDIACVLNIALTCFQPFNLRDMVCILLAFRNRRLSSKWTCSM